MFRDFIIENRDKWIQCGPPFTKKEVTIKLCGIEHRMHSAFIISCINDERRFYISCDVCDSVQPLSAQCQVCESKNVSKLMYDPDDTNLCVESFFRSIVNTL